jgi:hypothetical protein
MDGLRGGDGASKGYLHPNRNRKNQLIDSNSIRLPTRRLNCRYCRPGITQIPRADVALNITGTGLAAAGEGPVGGLTLVIAKGRRNMILAL